MNDAVVAAAAKPPKRHANRDIRKYRGILKRGDHPTYEQRSNLIEYNIEQWNSTARAILPF